MVPIIPVLLKTNWLLSIKKLNNKFDCATEFFLKGSYSVDHVFNETERFDESIEE